MEYMKILETPGGSGYVKRAMAALAGGWNVVLLLPDTVRNQTFVDTAKKSLRAQGGPLLNVADASRHADAAGLGEIMAAMPVTDRKKKRRTFAEHFRPQDSDYLKVTAFIGLERLSEQAQLVAAKEFAAAAETSFEGPQGGEGREGMRFMALVRPGFPQIPEARGIRYFPWWGATSRADFDLLFEEAATGNGKELSEADYWWCKAVAAGVGGDDPVLIGTVVEREPKGIEDVRAILSAHPLAHRIPQDFSFESNLLYPGISPSRSAPPDRGRDQEMWAEGLLSPNRYTLYHPALLSSGGALLDRFLSRGQRDVLFPLVDQVHGAVVRILEDELGPGCWEHYVTDDSLRDAALREMGPLAKAMKDYIRPESSGLRFFVKELCDLAYGWKLVRHSAAHSQMLDYWNWVRAVDLYQKYREKQQNGQLSGARLRAY
ncbi:MAG: hypothetical protein LBR80_01560 [Deltaproteobacteria bacterium]|jgi:hypothetical protein|nr:hypothetical protein [Deltaproteobacteria bacterium]